MRKHSRSFLVFLAILLALPMQAYAFYAASDCPMAAAHLDGSMPMDDCEGCEAGGACGLMNFCQSLQPGVLSFTDAAVAMSALGLHFLVTAADFRTRALAPPHEPPRTL